MIFLKLLVLGVVFCVNFVSSENIGSLTFVIGTAASMDYEIKQVKESFNAIFDAAAMNSIKPQIGNFALVTFNDTSTQVRAVTKDREAFVFALSTIEIEGVNINNDCPGYSLSGIKTALEHTLPGSYILVFTDASAKDKELSEEVIQMAISRRSQIVFILTGKCATKTDLQVYYNIAQATTGQVFLLGKENVKDILDTVRQAVENPLPRFLIQKSVAASNSSNNFNFSIDDNSKELLIWVSGEKIYYVDITGPDGYNSVEKIMDRQVQFIKLSHLNAGTYSVKVISKSGATVTVMERRYLTLVFN